MVREQVSPEIASYASQVAAQYANAARVELERIQEAFAGACRQMEEALGGIQADEHALAACVERLTAASETYARSRIETAAAEARAAIAPLQAELETVQRARAKADAELARLRDDLDAAHADAARAAAEREAEALAHQKTTAVLEATTQQLAGIEEQRRRVTALLEANGKRAEAAVRECEHLRARLEAAEEQAASASHDSDAIGFDRVQTYQHAVAFLSISLDRLLALYQGFAAGTQVDEVLDAVVASMATEFSRVVLFRVNSNHLEGVREVGFQPPMDMSRVVIPRAMNSLVPRAAASDRIEILTRQQFTDAADTPFGGTPNVVVALPLAVDGEPVAVVYADDADQPHRELVSPDVRRKFAELVRQQAAPFLARLAGERKQLADLDEYAAVLLKHLQSTHATDVRSSTPKDERHKRLSDNLEYARRLFAQRAHAQGPTAAALFDERLRAVVSDQSATAFGRDLGAALGAKADWRSLAQTGARS